MTSFVKFMSSMMAAAFPNGEQKKTDRQSETATQLVARILKQMDEAADTGDPEAQCRLGVLLSGGHGVPTFYSEAHYLFTLAALRKLPAAEFNLGLMFTNGMGVKKDPETAVEWFRRAAENGCADAQHYLGGALQRGWGIDKDLTAARSWYERAIKQGHAEARVALKELDAVHVTKTLTS